MMTKHSKASAQAVVKISHRTFTTNGPGTLWNLASVALLVIHRVQTAVGIGRVLLIAKGRTMERGAYIRQRRRHG